MNDEALTEAVVARSSPLALAVVDNMTPSGTAFVSADHLLELDRQLTDLCLGQTDKRRLAITMPPRWGKSSLVSKYLPAWFLANYPGKLVTVATAEASLATNFTRQTRAVIEDRAEMLGLEIDPRLRSGSDFRVRRLGSDDRFDGGLRAVGVGGSVVGRGSSCLVVDDPVKDSAAAHSATRRDQVWDWYTSTALTRLEPDAVLILCMTRWHLDDLWGRIMESEGERWSTVHIPAIGPDAESTWPERWPTSTVRRRREELGDYWFSSLYMGSPVSVEGAGQIFDITKIRRARDLSEVTVKPQPQRPLMPVEPPGRRAVITSQAVGTDLAFSEGRKADFSAVAHVLKTADGQYVIAHVARATVANSVQWAAKTIKDTTPMNVTVVADLLGGRPSQKMLKGEWSRELAGHTLNIRKNAHLGLDKVVAAQPFAAAVARGDVWILEGDFTETCLQELADFPVGKWDDQVDALAAAVAYLARGSGFVEF